MIVDLAYGRFQLPDTDQEAFWSVATEGFWDPELQPYLDRTPLGTAVIDVGAHVGLYAGYMASRGYRVTAMEAHPEYLPLLLLNMDANPWGGLVTVLPLFAYSRRVGMREEPRHTVRASNTWIPVAEGEGAGVYAFPLDLVTMLLPRSCRLGLLKVDAQGADLHVLLGAEAVIAASRPNILIEYEAPLAQLHGHTADDYRRWIEVNRYREHAISGLNAFLEPL